MLDGKGIFEFVANKCKEIADRQPVKNVLAVSIGYRKERSKDYTPTKVSEVTGGGAPQFMNFIEAQLIPKIERDYNADTSRAGWVILGYA